MKPPRVLIFGGYPDHLYQATRLLPGTCTVGIFPLLHQLNEKDLHPIPDLVIIFQEDPSHKALNCLSSLREKLPDIPVFFLADQPDRQDIIQAFRHGVEDYLLFPLHPDEFLRIIEPHLKKRSRKVLPSLFNRLGRVFHDWFSSDGADKSSDSVHVFKIPPGVLPSGNLFLPPNESKEPHQIEVRFFGPLTIKILGKILKKLPGEKFNAVLAYLLYHHEKSIHRETLLSRFWGDNPPSAARKSLNVAIHNIRRHFQEAMPEEELIHYENDFYSISPALDISTDADQFLRHWRSGRSKERKENRQKALPDYQRAASFYRGDFLEDIHYDEWCESERDNMKEIYLFILDRMAAHFFANDAYPATIQVLQKMLGKDDCLEDVHRKLILCYYRLGYRDKAIRQYYKCAEILRKELNIEPSLSTRELFRLISAEKNVTMALF